MPAIYTSASPAVLRKVAAMPPRAIRIEPSIPKFIVRPKPVVDAAPEPEIARPVTVPAPNQPIKCGFRNCDKTFVRNLRAKPRRYCSDTCGRKEKRLIRGAPTVEVKCDHPDCGNVFKASRGQRTRGGARYCCRGCSDRHKKGLPPWTRRKPRRGVDAEPKSLPLGTQGEHR